MRSATHRSRPSFSLLSLPFLAILTLMTRFLKVSRSYCRTPWRRATSYLSVPETYPADAFRCCQIRFPRFNLSVRKADLTGAALAGVKAISKEELDKEAGSLEGATMPNGSKYGKGPRNLPTMLACLVIAPIFSKASQRR